MIKDISNPPKPATLRATLVSDGFPGVPRWTTHHFSHAELVLTEPDGDEVWAMVWECFLTGAKRRWGIEVTAWDLDGTN